MFNENREKTGKVILNIFGVILLVYTIAFMYGMISSSFAEADIPNEYQEVSNIQLTESFLKGINPYSLKGALGGEAPGVVYVYGPVYSLITAFFALIIPVDLITLHYAVSLIAMLISGLLGAWIVKENTESVFSCVAAFLLIIVCTWRYGYINAVPDALAFMFVVLAVFIETRRSVKFKEVLEMLCIVAAFFTKMYMAYIALPLLIFKLIKDRRAALRFLLSGILITGAVSAIVTVMCPLYWTYSVYFIHGPWKPLPGQVPAAGRKDPVGELIEVLTFRNTTEPSSGWGYEALQLRTLIGTFPCLFAAGAAACIGYIRKKFSDIGDVPVLMTVAVISSIPVMLVLGKNDGAWLSYYLQIQVFPLAVLTLIYLDGKCKAESGKKAGVYAWIVLYGAVMLFTVCRTSKRLPYYYMTPEQRKVWDSTYALLDEYSDKGEIYYSPVLGFHAIKNGQFFYNNGLAGRSMIRLYNEYCETAWQQRLFPHAGEVMKKRVDYMELLSGRLRNGDYVLVTAIEGGDGTDRVIKIEDIKGGPYEVIGDTDLPVSRTGYTVTLWRRADMP